VPSRSRNFQPTSFAVSKERDGQPRYNATTERSRPSTLATWGTKKQRAVVKDGPAHALVETEEATPGVPMGRRLGHSGSSRRCARAHGYPSQKPEALLERPLARFFAGTSSS